MLCILPTQVELLLENYGLLIFSNKRDLVCKARDPNCDR